MSDYQISVVHAVDGRVAVWRPGSPIETDMIDDLCTRLAARGVGVFATEAKVLQAVREEFAALLYDLKRKVR